ncbi:unnamed protein product [Thelazia callipaeda]|uniref:Rhomboid protease n=1 Tax=Thelazia callipaeda TaxID=103827 RepID=A0A0N5D0A2_THECL|nr:unnamed protein product [Thelazia callipaeda]
MANIEEARNEHLPTENHQPWISIFHKFDTNYDGYIPTSDLKRFVHSSAASFGLTKEQAIELLENVDKNRDHLVDFAEFCTLMSRAKKLRMRHVLFRAAQMVVPKSERTAPFNYLQQYNCCPPPLFMLGICILQVVVYIYEKVEFESGTNSTLTVQSVLMFDISKTEQVWRYITYMLIHFGIMHLIFNLLGQITLGIPLELVHKSWRIATVYLSGVVAGALLHHIFDPKINLIGASGGVYALLAAHIAELLVNWSEMECALCRAFGLAVLISIDISLVIFSHYYFQEEGIYKVSHATHIGGFIAGILMGTTVLRNFRTKKWERVIWWLALATAILLFIVSVTFQIMSHV